MNFLIMQRPFVKKLSSSKKGEMKKKKASVENWKAFKVVHDEYLSKRIRFILRIDDFSFPEYFFFSISIFLVRFVKIFLYPRSKYEHRRESRLFGSKRSWIVVVTGIRGAKGFFHFEGSRTKESARTGMKGSVIDRVSMLDSGASAARLPGNSRTLESSWILQHSVFFGGNLSIFVFRSSSLRNANTRWSFFFYYYCKRRLQRRLKISLVQSRRGMKERCAKVWNESNFTSSKKFAHWFFRKREFISAESGKRRWIEFPWWRKSGFSWFFFFSREKFLLNVTRACGRKACRKVCSLRVQIVDIIQNDITSNDRRNKRRIVLALIKMDRSLKLDLFTFSLDHF